MARPTLTLEWLPGQSPQVADGSWANITAYLSAFTTQVGREVELERFSSGTATFQLRDTTRRFDPEWTSGAWYGQLTPGKQIRLKATYNAVTYDLWRGYVSDWGAADIPDRDNLYRTTVTCHDALTQFETMGLPASWLELAISSDSPTHWWKLDETTTGSAARDTANQTTLYDGGYYGSPTLADTELVPYDAGRKAPLFSPTSGVGIYVESGAPSTVELWFSMAAVPATTTAWLFSSGTTTDVSATVRPRWALGINTSGYYRLEVYTTTGSNSMTGAVNLCDGNEHQLTVTQTTANNPTVYVDSVAKATGAFTPGTGNTPGGNSIINGNPTVGEVGADAHICNVSYYAAALSAADVADHYSAGVQAKAGNDTGATIGIILDYKAWPASLRTLGTGASIVGAYSLPSTVAEFVGRMADTEAGQTYVDGAGKLTHRNRHLWLDARSKTSQATFGDLHGAATLQYLADGFAMPLDESQVRNPVYATRQDGVTASAQDSTLISGTYGERGYQAPVAYDSDDNVMADRARYYLSRFKNGKTRLKAMTIAPDRSPTLLYPQALGRLIGDRITVKRKPLNAGNETALDFIIEGIRHESTPGSWLTTFSGSQADATVGWILDDATYSVLDSTTVLTY